MATAAERARSRLEERVVEIQVLADETLRTTEQLIKYDRRENAAHLALQTADDRTAEILERQLIAGDAWEATELERIRARATQLATEGFALAGEITAYLERRGQAQLFPVERAS